MSWGFTRDPNPKTFESKVSRRWPCVCCCKKDQAVAKDLIEQR